MINFWTFFVGAASGFSFFVLGKAIWTLAGLFVITIATRFNSKFEKFGKFTEMLFLFCLISFLTNQLSFADSIRQQTRLQDAPGISYPYSLIIIIAVLLLPVFYEGPEWSRLFFAPGETKRYFKLSLGLTLFASIILGAAVFFQKDGIENPVPLEWPIDTLIILGLGFAFYLAIIEETIFRSFILERAQSVVGMYYAIPIQGTFYGLMYYKSGVPGGAVGVISSALFGICLGYLVKKSGSIYLSMFVRFIVTFVLFLELTILGKYQLQ